MGGSTGDRLIRVDMTDHTVSIEPYPDAWRLLGGRALSARILLEECDPTCDPLGPDNVLERLIEPVSAVPGQPLRALGFGPDQAAVVDKPLDDLRWFGHDGLRHAFSTWCTGGASGSASSVRDR